MNVLLYNFSKRKNSTKQPDPTTATTIRCQLKDAAAVMNPVLQFNPETSGFSTPFNPSQYNYAHLPLFSRYYFIDDWVWLNGLWECHLTVDVMASYKLPIGNTNSYIIRSDTAYDGTIIDGLYPATTETTITRIALNCSWHNVAPSGGCYIIGIINNVTSGNIGAICYYALTASELASLLSWLFSDAIYNASSIDEIGNGLYKSIFNPFQYIVSSMWLPFSLGSIAESASTAIVVGYWNSGISAHVVRSLAHITFITGTIPNHPQIARGTFLNYAPYTALTMYVEPFGSVPIDTSFRNRGNYLYAEVTIDHITGDCVLRPAIITDPQTEIIFPYCGEKTAKIGVPVQLAQVASDYLGTISNAGSALGNLLTLNPMGVASGIVNALESSMPKVSTSGVNGSFAVTIPDPVLVCEFKHIVAENRSENGRPLMDNRTINTLSGFVKCGEADHAFSGMASENDMINAFMKNGFFYE